MDYAVIISSIVLGLSVLASIAKFLDWFLHSDPRTMVRTTRWMLLLLLLACIPVLVLAIAREQWALAMLSGAGMLVIGSFLKWRALLAPLRAALTRLRPRPRPFDMEVWEEANDAEKVRRAAALLEAYVSKSAVPALIDQRPRTMTSREALEILGLPDDADEAAIRAAHLRLSRLVHPDNGGSSWLFREIQKARDALITNAPHTRNVA